MHSSYAETKITKLSHILTNASTFFEIRTENNLKGFHSSCHGSGNTIIRQPRADICQVFGMDSHTNEQHHPSVPDVNVVYFNFFVASMSNYIYTTCMYYYRLIFNRHSCMWAYRRRICQQRAFLLFLCMCMCVCIYNICQCFGFDADSICL